MRQILTTWVDWDWLNRLYLLASFSKGHHRMSFPSHLHHWTYPQVDQNMYHKIRNIFIKKHFKSMWFSVTCTLQSEEAKTAGHDSHFMKWNRAWTSVLSGHIGFWHFWQVCPHKEFQKMVVISFEHLEKISNFTKFHDCGSKTELAMPISNLNLNCL